MTIAWTDCFDCPLAICRKKVVGPRGSLKDRKLMFVGEAPGAEEEKNGVAFVGPSGALLDKWITQMDLPSESFYITNVVKCRPPNNRDPTEFEVESCLPHLACEIRELKPALIVPLGRFAKMAVSHMRDEGDISESQYTLGLKHPAFYLRQGGYIPVDELGFLRKKLLMNKCAHRWMFDTDTGQVLCSFCGQVRVEK